MNVGKLWRFECKIILAPNFLVHKNIERKSEKLIFVTWMPQVCSFDRVQEHLAAF